MRDVTDFAQSSGTLTIGVAWATNPTSSYTFSVKRGFQKKIEVAFEEMLLDVKSRWFRPALIIESSELKIPLIKKALSIICRDYITEPNDKWDVLAKEYEEQYKSSFAKVKFQYDKNESGYIGTSNEEDLDLGSVRMKR